MATAAGLRGRPGETTETPGNGVAAASIRVVIAVGVRLYRDGVSAAFRRQADFDVVAIGPDAAHAAELVGAHEADVALLDLSRHDDPGLRDALSVVREQLVTHPELVCAELGFSSGVILAVKGRL